MPKEPPEAPPRPPSGVGRPPRELALRLAYVDFDGAAALRACAEREIDEGFLRQHCGRVLAAIESMCEWVGR